MFCLLVGARVCDSAAGDAAGGGRDLLLHARLAKRHGLPVPPQLPLAPVLPQMRLVRSQSCFHVLTCLAFCSLFDPSAVGLGQQQHAPVVSNAAPAVVHPSLSAAVAAARKGSVSGSSGSGSGSGSARPSGSSYTSVASDDDGPIAPHADSPAASPAARRGAGGSASDSKRSGSGRRRRDSDDGGDDSDGDVESGGVPLVPVRSARSVQA